MVKFIKCDICKKEVKSYNPNPKYCSWECKSKSQIESVDFDKAKELYESGMSQEEVAETLNVTQKIICNLFKRKKYKCRVAKKRNQYGENNDSWKGDNVGYVAFHRRMEALKGKPKKCEICGTEEKKRTYDWANLTGKYNDPNDYKRMCRSCHFKRDKIHLNFQGGKKNARE